MSYQQQKVKMTYAWSLISKQNIDETIIIRGIGSTSATITKVIIENSIGIQLAVISIGDSGETFTLKRFGEK